MTQRMVTSVLTMWATAATAAQSVASAASVPAAAAASAIPYLADNGQSGSLMLRSGSALLLCAALTGAVVYAAMRLRKSPLKPLRKRSIDIIETKSLSTRARLLVVRYEDRQLLLAHTEQGVSLLHEKAHLPAQAGTEP